MRALRLLLLGLVLMLFAAPVAAQKQVNTLSAVVELSNGYTVVLPDGWELDSLDDDIAVFVNDDATIMLFDPTVVANLFDGDTFNDPADGLIAAYDAFYDDQLDDSEIDNDDFAGFDAALWEFSEGSRRDGVFILAQLDDEAAVAFDIVTPAGEIDDALDAAAEILASLRGDGVSIAADPAAEEPITVAVSDEPCVVSTDSADTVRLRVGPGENRTSVAFLPAGVEVDVVGRFTADDGSEWFRLDKDQAAPRSAANEIWVLRDDVDESGGCDAVVDASAPPVVPITNAPPPAPPASDSGSPAADSETTTTSSGGIVPLAGTWTFNFARQSNASCVGYENAVWPTNETWSNWTEADFTWRGTLTVQGTNIVFDGDVYRLNGTNSYVGSFNRLDGFSNQIYLNFTSPTTLSGQFTGNFTYEGAACSATTTFSGSRG
jgi:hypothetical protein